jgi:hypothetical protein
VRVPIHDLSYQHWRGVPSTRSPVSVLMRDQMRLLLRRRVVRLLLLVSGLFTLVWGAMIYVESGLPVSGPLRQLADTVRVDAQCFRRFLTMQRLVHLLLCLAAADLIALDRRHRALQICRSTWRARCAAPTTCSGRPGRSPCCSVSRPGCPACSSCC